MPKVRRHNHIYDVLSSAIDALSKYPEHTDLVEQLTYERSLLKPPKWTESAIEEAFDNFVQTHGRIPTTEDMKTCRDLPPHPSIELRFGMTAAQWLDQRYPHRKTTKEDRQKAYTEEFIAEYTRLKPYSPKDYESRRDKDHTHSWIQVASYYDLQAWSKLVNILKLPIYNRNGREAPKESYSIKVNIISDIDF